MSGKLIVIEGLDGSGKSTQLEILCENLKKSGYNCISVSFPDYDSPSSAPIKMYLSGKFGKNPNDVNAYAASAFYAVDRFASFKQNWCEFYQNGGIVVAGRYVTSNAVHQCSKMPKEKWCDFTDWLYDFEYNKMGIPVPDKIIFLDMPLEVSQKLLSNRYSGDESQKDIHERNTDYLKKCHEAAFFAANRSNWHIVRCANGENARTVEEISADVLNAAKEVL